MSMQRGCWLSLVERLFVRCVPFDMLVLFQELTRWSCQCHGTSQYPHFDSHIENTSVLVSLSTISSRVGVTWCSIWMAVLRSGVQVEPQTPALLAAITKTVEPFCEFIFFDLRCNVISRLVPFWCSSSGWMSHALGDGQLGVNYVLSTMWCSPWNLPTALKHSGYWLITSCLSFSRVTSLKLYRCRVW